MSIETTAKDGNLEISEAVLITFVEKTVGEFDGISLSRRRKTIKITRADSGCTIDLGLDVNYGTDIPQVAKELQASIKECITKLAGVKVAQVNIIVEGLNLEELIKK